MNKNIYLSTELFHRSVYIHDESWVFFFKMKNLPSIWRNFRETFFLIINSFIMIFFSGQLSSWFKHHYGNVRKAENRGKVKKKQKKFNQQQGEIWKKKKKSWIFLSILITLVIPFSRLMSIIINFSKPSSLSFS